jgi:hypothetical protein
MIRNQLNDADYARIHTALENRAEHHMDLAANSMTGRARIRVAKYHLSEMQQYQVLARRLERMREEGAHRE